MSVHTTSLKGHDAQHLSKEITAKNFVSKGKVFVAAEEDARSPREFKPLLGSPVSPRQSAKENAEIARQRRALTNKTYSKFKIEGSRASNSRSSRF